MSSHPFVLLPAPPLLLPILWASARLPSLESSAEGGIVGVSALAFRCGVSIETHDACVLKRARKGDVRDAPGVVEEEIRGMFFDGRERDGAPVLQDPALARVYMGVRDAARMDESCLPSWTQRRREGWSDMRSLWVLKDAVVLFERPSVERLVSGEDPSNDDRSVVFYDAATHGGMPPESAVQAQRMGRRTLAHSLACAERAYLEHADMA